MKTYTHTCETCEEEVSFSISPDRPAPYCLNHDSPAFSDPGDPAEIEGPEECPKCKTEFDLDKILDTAIESIDWFNDDYPEREDDR